jgi:hypothetical protein
MPSTTTTVSVAWRDRPFDGAFHRHLVPFAGRPPTIADAIKAVPDLPDVFHRVGEVRLNGELVPREWWPRVRPRGTGGSCITLHMPLMEGGGQSGGSGAQKKNPLATVAMIGVLLAAAAVSGGALGAAGGVLGLGTLLAGGPGAASPAGGSEVWT